VFTFAAETRDGLITRSSFRVHIEPRSESRPREDRRRGRGRGRNRGGRSH
jgi:hypothetical protein